MPSSEFVAAYRSGKIRVTPVAMRWIAYYEAMLKLAPEFEAPVETDLLISA